MATNLASGQLTELGGLIEAFKALVFKAANEQEMSRDTIDWRGVQMLCDRAAVLVMDLEHNATAKDGAR